jgi:hypothetical protein
VLFYFFNFSFVFPLKQFYRNSGSVVSVSASSMAALAILTNRPSLVVPLVVGVPLGAVVLLIVVNGVSKRILKNNGQRFWVVIVG